MRLRFSPTVFLLAYCAVYIAALATDFPAFRYYPLEGHLSWGPRNVEGMGPAMAWYGILAEAALAAGVLAVVVPDRPFDKVLHNFRWAVPVVAMLVCIVLMKRFFE